MRPASPLPIESRPQLLVAQERSGSQVGLLQHRCRGVVPVAIRPGRDRAVAWRAGAKPDGSAERGASAVVITSSVTEVRSGLQDVPALPIQRILFPTDFSVSAEAAWPYAAGLAREGGAELHLLHVVAPPAIGASPDGTVLWPPPLVSELLAEARAAVDNLADRMLGLGVATRTHASFGDTAPEIIAYSVAQGIGLIVMATTGRTGAAHLLLGSVAEQVCQASPVPVLLFPARALQAIPAEAQAGPAA